MSVEIDNILEDQFDCLIEYAPEEDEDHEIANNLEQDKSDAGIAGSWLRSSALCRAMRTWPLVNAVSVAQIPVHDMYVCSLCLRQYDVLPDLRGHLVEFHKYQSLLIQTVPPERSMPAEEDELETAEVPVSANERVIQKAEDLRPMPFKDFRLFLRAKLRFRCMINAGCSYAFEDENKRLLHEKCHVNSKLAKVFACTECALELENWRRCTTHMWKEHQIDVDQLQCPICKFKAHASVLIWRHMRIHARWRPLVLRALRRESARQRNQLSANDKRGGINSSSSTAKKAPVVAKTTPPTVNKNRYYSEKTCDICARKFVNGKTLSKHVKTVHNKVKPFICNVCGQKMARKASLEVRYLPELLNKMPESLNMLVPIHRVECKVEVELLSSGCLTPKLSRDFIWVSHLTKVGKRSVRRRANWS